MREHLNTIQEFATPILKTPRDYDPILEAIGDRRYVLLGEASHGTQEFYQIRAEITRRLIEEKGFNVIAIEADWPDSCRVHRFINQRGEDSSALEALGGFARFPTWMWRNRVTLKFIDWSARHNQAIPKPEDKIGFYGLDLYSLHTSINEVLKYLEEIDPVNAEQARRRYACFDHFGNDSQAYGYATGAGYEDSCEPQVIKQLIEITQRAADYANRDGVVAEDDYFMAEQNARLVKNAEEYYRSMYRGRVSSWNLRDTHMFETLELLMGHLTRQSRNPKVVVWAHNSHLGNARGTQMADRGEFNIGQLVREKYPQDSYLLGFTTYTGTVTAARDWGAATETKQVRKAMKGSYEALFHDTGMGDFHLDLRAPEVRDHFWEPPMLERAIGVIYRPDTEFQSHYLTARLPQQFDGIIHLDVTHALEPLDSSPHWVPGRVAETFPSAL